MTLVWFSHWLARLFLFFSFFLLPCLVYLNCLVSVGVCSCSFNFSSKPQSPRPCSHRPGLWLRPPHLPRRTADTQASMHTSTHTTQHTHTHTHAGAGARLHIRSSTEACASFFNAHVTSHPHRFWTFIQTTSSFPHLKQDANRNTGKALEINWTAQKAAKRCCWMQISNIVTVVSFWEI